MVAIKKKIHAKRTLAVSLSSEDVDDKNLEETQKLNQEDEDEVHEEIAPDISEF